MRLRSHLGSLAMSLHLPNLEGTNLSRLRLTFYVRNADAELKTWVQSVGARHGADIGGGWWLHDDYYLFQSAVQEMVCSATLSLEKEGINPNLETAKPMDVLLERFSHIAGREAIIKFDADHITPKDKIPKGGKIDAFIGVSSGVDRIGMDLSGIKMRVRGSVIGEFEWELLERTVDDKPVTMVESTLGAWFMKGEKADERSLLNASILASDAYRFFVLDEAPVDSLCVPEGGG